MLTFENHDVYYLSGYIKGFQIHGDGVPLLFYYNNNNFRAINVVMKRDISEHKEFKGKIKENEYFDLSTPYGYGGFILEGELSTKNLNELDKTYTKYCKENNIVSEFVRFHPVLENSKLNNSIYEVNDLGDTITIDLKSEEFIWDNLTSKNRNVIRKAQKSGVEIYWGRSEELFSQFVPMYNSTMQKDDASDYYYFNYEFYKSILEDLQYNSMFFYAVYNEQIISMAIILFNNKKMHYHLSASDYKFRNLAATNLLLYKVACWGSLNGFETFHLGGGLGSKEDGLYKFKKSFSKKSKTFFSIGKKIFDQDKYDTLVQYRVENDLKSIQSTFFPKYRG